ncbi:fused MFS/spermidine synthase [Elusimicrobiota bacterium]
MINNKNFSIYFILISFFLSGFAALIYETLWVRLFSLYFGHTTIAVSAVLAAFMAGLCIGSLVFGKISDRINPKNLLKYFAFFEIITFILAWLSSPLFLFFQNQLLKIGITAFSNLTQASIWFITAFVILIIPTMAMGATLPVVLKWIKTIHIDEKPSNILGLIYGINTIGAVFGVVFAGFYLIPSIGITNCFLFAGLFNIIAGLIALVVNKINYLKIAYSKQVKILSNTVFPKGSIKYSIYLFLTGFAAMAAEVVWTRTFSLVLGSSTYSFTIMLTTFLLCFALGALSFSLVRKYFSITLAGFSVILIFISVSMLAYLPLINWLPYYFIRLFPLTMHWPSLMPFIKLLLCSTIMIIPTFFTGLLFPWAMELVDPKKDEEGKTTGILYASNTMGNIFGSLIAGLMLIPIVGIESSIFIIVAVYSFTAILTIFSNKKFGLIRKKLFVAGITVIIVLGILFNPGLNKYVLSSGAFIYAPQYMGFKNYKDYSENCRFHEMLFYKDGISATITVYETPWEERFLRTNGKTDASTGKDMITQLLHAYIPILFSSKNPKNTLIIGLGSGITAGAMATCRSIEEIDCVEIEPAVADAAKYFSKFNKHIMYSDKLKLIFTDGRNYLNSTDKKYDIIASEPSNPWISGISSLFTKEAFELSKNALSENGIFCQWFYSYSMSEKDFKMVMNTFASVFPYTMLTTTTSNDYFLIGSLNPIIIDYKKVHEIFETNTEMYKDLIMIELGHPFKLIAKTYMLNDEEFREYSRDAEMHIDDLPTLEFSAPLYLYKGEHIQIYKNLLEMRKNFLLDNIVGLEVSDIEKEHLYNISGESFMRSKNLIQANMFFEKAFDLNQNNPRTLSNMGRIFNLQNKHLQSVQYFKKALELDPNYALAMFHLGMLYIQQGFDAKGLEMLEKGLDIEPYDPMGCLQASLIYVKNNEHMKAKDTITRALSKPIPNQDIQTNLMLTLNKINMALSEK